MVPVLMLPLLPVKGEVPLILHFVAAPVQAPEKVTSTGTCPVVLFAARLAPSAVAGGFTVMVRLAVVLPIELLAIRVTV